MSNFFCGNGNKRVSDKSNQPWGPNIIVTLDVKAEKLKKRTFKCNLNNAGSYREKVINKLIIVGRTYSIGSIKLN